MRLATNLIARTRQRLNSLRAWRPSALPRPAQMLLTVAMTLALGVYADSLTGWTVLSKIKNLDHASPAEAQSWSALNYALLLIGGLPVAFLIWHWRDVNVRDQIENARKDINLKEFQEVQLRAAGALDEKLPLEAREQLQIAALHQLRGFLRGDYGDSFKRPAFELLLAGHAAAVFRIGVPEVQAQLAGKTGKAIGIAVKAIKSKLGPIDHARLAIIRDDARHIFAVHYPLVGRRFDLVDLSEIRFPNSLDMTGSSWFGATLDEAELRGAKLSNAQFEGASFSAADLRNAELIEACFRGARLVGINLEHAFVAEAKLEEARMFKANLKHAQLLNAHLNGASLISANLQGADFEAAHIEGANLDGAALEDANLQDIYANSKTSTRRTTFNSQTKFRPRSPSQFWDDMTEAEREEARAPWLARGMVRSDLPPPVEEEQPAAPAPD